MLNFLIFCYLLLLFYKIFIVLPIWHEIFIKISRTLQKLENPISSWIFEVNKQFQRNFWNFYNGKKKNPHFFPKMVVFSKRIISPLYFLFSFLSEIVHLCKLSCNHQEVIYNTKLDKTNMFSLKGPKSYLFHLFPNFWRFCYHKKAHIFLITHVKFHD